MQNISLEKCLYTQQTGRFGSSMRQLHITVYKMQGQNINMQQVPSNGNTDIQHILHDRTNSGAVYMLVQLRSRSQNRRQSIVFLHTPV